MRKKTDSVDSHVDSHVNGWCDPIARWPLFVEGKLFFMSLNLSKTQKYIRT